MPPIPKPTKKKTKKPKAKTKGYYQRKADALYQELGRQTYDRCLVCGEEYSCLHHLVKKSQSTALRYDFKNGVPLCNRCHCGIHQGVNDLITGRIVAIMGQEWLDELERKKKEGLGKNYGINWYKEMIEFLNFALGK
jgi:hypothetical protein